MARARKRSDDVYNARRRYFREADSYAKRAAKATGIEAKRLETLGRTSLEKAIALYDDPVKSQNSPKVKRLAEKLKPRKAVRKASESAKSRLMKESSYHTKTAFKDDEYSRRDQEAQDILRSDIGNRVYGALVSIWQDSPYSDRDTAILDYFGTDSMMDVLDAISDAGIDLYSDPSDLPKYQEILTAIQRAFI